MFTPIYIVRRPHQGQLYSRALVFGGGQAPKHFAAKTRKRQVRCGGIALCSDTCTHWYLCPL